MASSILSVPAPSARGARRSTRALLAATLATGLCLLATACRPSSPAGEAASGQVIAEVGSRTIVAGDLITEASRRVENRRPVPAKDQLLAEMVEREALLQRARQAGLDRDPGYQREVESLLIRKLQAAQLDPRRESVNVSDAAVKAEYETNAARFARPAQARLAMLFLAADARSSEARKGELRARIEEGRRKFVALAAKPQPALVPGFGPLAVDYSDDQVTRHRGGDLGWLEADKHPSRVPVEVAEAGWALAPGQVSEVIPARDGFYVMLKTDSRPAAVTPLESLQASLRQTLLVRKRNELEEQFRAETARQFPARVDTQALATVRLSEAPATLAARARNREPQPPVLPGTTESSHGN